MPISSLRGLLSCRTALAGLPLLAAALPAVAYAGDMPLYQPAPDWVVPAPRDAGAAAPNPPTLRLLDFQKRIDHGQVISYSDTAIRIDTPDALARSGTVALAWAPDHGDLLVHSVDILRGGQRIDVLASGARFTVLRREEKLAALELNGILTATLAVDGLRVGDVLEVRHSISERDPALAGHAETTALLLPQPMRLGFGRVRVLWDQSEKLRWKSQLSGVTASETERAGWHELTITTPVARQPDPAQQAPGRYAITPLAEFSDFADWAEVSRTMAPLFSIDTPAAAIRPGGDLDAALARIAAATSDPRQRAALALQLVQDQVRYFAVTMNGGNLVPQPVEQTWAKRYGDCKAKTLLLLAVLHRLGIAAEPALAHLELGDKVHDRLPSVAAFNHIFVLAHVGEATLWLDGTGLGSRLADLDDVPAYGWVLPLRAGGADLIHAPQHAPARPTYEMHLDLDLRGGLNIMAPCRVQVQIRGSQAGQLNVNLANLDGEERADVLRKVMNSTREQRLFTRPQFHYDAATGEATITAEGVASGQWKRQDSRYAYDTGLFAADKYPDRSRDIWQAIPVMLGTPGHTLVEETFHLPQGGARIAMQGASDQLLPQPGLGTSRAHADLGAGIWHVVAENWKDGGEFPASALPAIRHQDADFVAKAPRLRTEPGYDAPWQGVEAARRAHLYDHAIATLDRYITEKPEDGHRYRLRALFYASTFDRPRAIADFSKALNLNADKALYHERAGLYEALGDDAHALADLRAAFDLDPSDLTAMSRLTRLQALAGEGKDALARLDAAIDAGGDNEPFYRHMKAVVLADMGDGPGALEQMDAALDKRSGHAQLLNGRCWLKGLLNTDLDNALLDCGKAIQVGDKDTAQALDSRGLIHLRQQRYAEAIADFDAALDLRPGMAGSYFLRALAERGAGQTDAAAHDLAAARWLAPAIERLYRRFGLQFRP